MDSTYLREFEQPIKISNDARDYLQNILSNAEVLFLEKKYTDSEQKYDCPDIGEIKLYVSENLGPEIQFSPEGWYRLYNQYIDDLLRGVESSIHNLDYDMTVSNKPDVGKFIYLTLNGSENNQLCLNPECIRTNSEECINLLQTVWNRMVSRYSSERISLDEQLKPPICQD